MLTISQVAAYAGVSVRTVRWPHGVGRLRAPRRDGSVYRRYGGQAVVDLVRISTLAGSGVPLARIRELLHAGAAEFKAAVTELDAELATRIEELQQRRADLAQLPSAERLCVPDKVAELLDLERSIGISERTIAMERDAWILLAATYPEMLDDVYTWKELTTRDPDFQQLMLAMDEAYDWDPDDPRLADLAQRCLEVMGKLYPAEAASDYMAEFAVDANRYSLISDYGSEDSPAWVRLNGMVEELSRECGYPTW